jgi:uncharacterized protein (DUF2062 family)
MLFRRRTNVTLQERVRIMLWPRRSFRRSARYFVKRALRLRATPHAIAAGVASGVFCSFTPFIGFHFLLSFIVAWPLRGNLVAAALGTALGNPITFPFILGATLQLGRFLLRHEEAADIGPEQIGDMLMHLEFSSLWEPILKPMLLGAALLGAAAGFIAYFIVRMAVRTFHEQRRKRLAERAKRQAVAQTVEINATVG